MNGEHLRRIIGGKGTIVGDHRDSRHARIRRTFRLAVLGRELPVAHGTFFVPSGVTSDPEVSVQAPATCCMSVSARAGKASRHHSFHTIPNQRTDHLLATDPTYKRGRLILQTITFDLEKPHLFRPIECLVRRDFGVEDQLITLSLIYLPA